MRKGQQIKNGGWEENIINVRLSLDSMRLCKCLHAYFRRIMIDGSAGRRAGGDKCERGGLGSDDDGGGRCAGAETRWGAIHDREARESANKESRYTLLPIVVDGGRET